MLQQFEHNEIHMIDNYDNVIQNYISHNIFHLIEMDRMNVTLLGILCARI